MNTNRSNDTNCQGLTKTLVSRVCSPMQAYVTVQIMRIPFIGNRYIKGVAPILQFSGCGDCSKSPLSEKSSVAAFLGCGGQRAYNDVSLS